MTASKFKIGDRVKWRDHEGRARSGVIVELPFGCPAQFDTCFIREAQELQPGRWHESHLSLDVPEPKKYATDLEARLGAEIIALHYAAADREKELTAARRQIEQLKQASKTQTVIGTHLNDRLTEEIGGRHRERIAKEAAEKQLLHASEMLICEKESFAKERRIREAVQADNRRLIDSKMMLLQEVTIERKAKEAAQKELAKADDSLHFQRMELRKAMEDRSVEWLANEAAKKELADVRKDLADLRVISKRLAL